MSFENYYINQCGGGGEFFTGRRYQKGHGLGNILGGLVRATLPVLKRTAISLGKDVASTGLVQGGRLIEDIIHGKPVKKSMKKRAIEGGRVLINKRIHPHKNTSTPKRKIKRRRVIKGKRSKDIFTTTA